MVFSRLAGRGGGAGPAAVPNRLPAPPGLSALPSLLLARRRLAAGGCEGPPLAAPQRTRLDDLDDVANLRPPFFVVHHELRRPPLGLPVEPVTHLPLDRHHDALLH